MSTGQPNANPRWICRVQRASVRVETESSGTTPIAFVRSAHFSTRRTFAKLCIESISPAASPVPSATRPVASSATTVFANAISPRLIGTSISNSAVSFARKRKIERNVRLVPRLNYSDVCSTDSDCLPTLICPTISGVCNCSQFLADHACNCPNDKYFDGTLNRCRESSSSSSTLTFLPEFFSQPIDVQRQLCRRKELHVSNIDVLFQWPLRVSDGNELDFCEQHVYMNDDDDDGWKEKKRIRSFIRFAFSDKMRNKRVQFMGVFCHFIRS